MADPLAGSHVAVIVEAVPLSVDLLPAVGRVGTVRSLVFPGAVYVLPALAGVKIVDNSAVSAGASAAGRRSSRGAVFF